MAKVHMFDVTLAEKYGPVESIILSHLCYWIEKNAANNNNYHKGRYWTYNSTMAFEKIFPYLNGKQIRRILDKLKNQGVLYTDNFNKIGYDRTLWYSVSDEVLEIYNAGKKLEPPCVKLPETDCPNGQMDVPNSGNAFAQTDINAQTGEWDENSEKKSTMTENETAGTENSKINCPNGQMDVPNSGNAFAQTDKCISQIQKIDLPNLDNRSPEFGQPIPNLNIYKPSTSSELEKEFELLKKIFLAIDRHLVFSKDFYETVRNVMNKYEIDEDYCRWLYRECLEMKPDNIRSLYYTLFDKQEMLELYISSGIKSNAVKNEPDIHCTVCGTVFKGNLDKCPACQMRVPDMDNNLLVEHHKRYLKLSDEQKYNYDNEFLNISRYLGHIPHSEFKARMMELEERYGFVKENVI